MPGSEDNARQGRQRPAAETSPGWHEPKTSDGSVPSLATTAMANCVGSDRYRPSLYSARVRDADMKHCLQIACKAGRADVGLRLSAVGDGGWAGGPARSCMGCKYSRSTWSATRRRCAPIRPGLAARVRGGYRDAALRIRDLGAAHRRDEKGGSEH
jgi:hypothetical protein